MALTSLGVIAGSKKENERRVPLHPRHFQQIPERIRQRLIVEEGYGEPFGIADSRLVETFGRLAPRASILESADAVLLPKPMPEDLRELREGGVLWGWAHCVQQQRMTQLAIDRKQTLITFESMFTWKDGDRDVHVFYRNNEMAGYCAVLHALDLAGGDGLYGPKLKAVVLSLGSVSRGAIYGLQGRGIFDVTVYTQRPPWSVRDQVPGCRYGQMVSGKAGHNIVVVDQDGWQQPLREVLSDADLIVNGILQDTDHPLMFLDPGEEQILKPRSIIVDVSCDEGMGFPFARPTSFEAPTFRVGDVTYYGVDHTPSYLWRSASWEISRVVMAFLETVMSGPSGWRENETIRRAIEIRDGVVRNRKILTFQNRAETYPHSHIG